jgi:CBS domain containing-hemolysin-like protein
VETLAGFLLSELGHIPVLGETIVHEGRNLRVEEMAGRRISKVSIEEVPEAASTEAPTEDDGLEVSA